MKFKFTNCHVLNLFKAKFSTCLKKGVFLFLFGISMLLVSCDSSVVYEENIKIENNAWSSEKPLVFQVNIKDTTVGHNVYINLRNASHYPFSNIFIFMNTTLPNGQLDRDTLEIMLASKDGKWLGNGLGDIWDNRILFKRNVSFPMPGEYRFELIQAMRLDPLPGIMDGGIRIEKVTP
ncbi:MAG: gliding motility lipoprotein GldH [Bacteroidetes bacterium]|nr:gliding motility lipoprotein GldH [Bacteroidota bacterium]